MTTQTVSPAIDTAIGNGLSEENRATLEALQATPTVETPEEKAARIAAKLDAQQTKRNPNRGSVGAENADNEPDVSEESDAMARFDAAVEAAKAKVRVVVVGPAGINGSKATGFTHFSRGKGPAGQMLDLLFAGPGIHGETRKPGQWPKAYQFPTVNPEGTERGVLLKVQSNAPADWPTSRTIREMTDCLTRCGYTVTPSGSSAVLVTVKA